MRLKDLFKKSKQETKVKNSAPPSGHAPDVTKEDIYKRIMAAMSQRSPSESFASGAVFDIVRQQHSTFETIVRSGDVLALREWFLTAYNQFCSNPAMVGFAPNMVNMNNNDLKIREVNSDVFRLLDGDAAALCFMPVQDDKIAARIIGVIIRGRGDGYYYCMLSKDETAFSDVVRNKALQGVETVGKVYGRGFELMDRFLDCIKNDFYSAK